VAAGRLRVDRPVPDGSARRSGSRGSGTQEVLDRAEVDDAAAGCTLAAGRRQRTTRAGHFLAEEAPREVVATLRAR